MSEPQEIIPIGKNDLVGMVAQLFAEGYRLVQIGCSTLESAYELNYSFDKEYRFKNLRITVAPGEEVPSISVIYRECLSVRKRNPRSLRRRHQKHHHRLSWHALPHRDQDAFQHGECQASGTPEAEGRCSIRNRKISRSHRQKSLKEQKE